MSSMQKISAGAASLGAWLISTTAYALDPWPETDTGSGTGGASSVPELDPDTAVLAIALLAAVALVLYGARKRTS